MAGRHIDQERQCQTQNATSLNSLLLKPWLAGMSDRDGTVVQAKSMVLEKSSLPPISMFPRPLTTKTSQLVPSSQGCSFLPGKQPRQ